MPVERLEVGRAAVTRRVVMTERMMPPGFFLNGRTFDHERVDFGGRLGTLEVWELENRGDMDHPFHLHSYPFQVIERNGAPEAYRAWKDVVNLRRNDRVKIGAPLRDFTGLTVYHCHILEHEDRGMMGTLEVRT
jgi:FtsP/CotA-like multicopper oxidase with cupredoxin domain